MIMNNEGGGIRTTVKYAVVKAYEGGTRNEVCRVSSTFPIDHRASHVLRLETNYNWKRNKQSSHSGN
jgi:hypothetical protein